MRNGTAIGTKISEDVDGKITSESYGNGYTTTYGYDTHRQLNEINSANGTNAQVAFRANYHPVVGWGVSIGITDYIYGDDFYNWLEKP